MHTSETYFSNDPTIQITTLDNGLTVATAKRPVHVAFVSVWVNTGGRFEAANEAGISHLLEHMAFKGTKTRTAKNIALDIEILGSDINAATGKSSTGYSVVGLADHIPVALEILADVLTKSTFKQEELEREQQVVIEEIYQCADDIEDVAFEKTIAVAYPDQALGRPILGYEETVLSFTGDMLDAYMRKHYHANSMIVVGAGDVDHESFVEEVKKHFSVVPSGEVNIAEPARYVGGTANVIKEGYEQAQIILAFPAPAQHTVEFAKYDLLSELLGSGISSPLFQELREKRSLCYSVYSGMFSNVDHSLFMIQGSASRNNVSDFVVGTCRELVKVSQGLIDDNDWTRARNRIKRSVSTQMDNLNGATNGIVDNLMIKGHISSVEEKVARYMDITREDIVLIAQDIVETNPTIIVAGNADDIDYLKLAKTFLDEDAVLDSLEISRIQLREGLALATEAVGSRGYKLDERIALARAKENLDGRS